MTAISNRIIVPVVGTLYHGRTVVLSRKRRRDGAAIFLTVVEQSWPYQVWIKFSSGITMHDATYRDFDEAYKTYWRV